MDKMGVSDYIKSRGPLRVHPHNDEDGWHVGRGSDNQFMEVFHTNAKDTAQAIVILWNENHDSPSPMVSAKSEDG